MAGDIVQVSIGDRSIGILGLKKVMTDLAATATGKTDEECREILYRGIAEQNYIPPKMVVHYKDALLRAFKVFTGEAPEEAPAGGVRIQVLGPGCHNCDRMEQDVREVLAELEMPGDLSHLYSHDNEWALQQPMQPNRHFKQRDHTMLFYNALHDRNIPVDFCRPTEDLSKDRLVIAPSMHLLAGGEADLLKLYVQNGGTLVGTCNTGLVDEYHMAPDSAYPHDLTDLFGLDVTEFDPLPPGEENHLTFKGAFPTSHLHPARLWCDIIEPRECQILATYAKDFYANRPAMTMRYRFEDWNSPAPCQRRPQVSTADGLLLTISNSLSHDLYYKMINPKASINVRLAVSRTLLVMVALVAAWVATYKITIIVELVGWAFSIAAASFFPALVMGVWDKRANKAGALAGMWIGFLTCVTYMVGSRFYRP